MMLDNTAMKQALSAGEHPILLDSPTQLEHAAKQWEGSEVLGIDTEFVRERTYRANLGLVQVSDGQTAWLVDPLAVGSLEPLARLMANTAITKILHSSSEDLEVLMYTLGQLPEPLVDTQIASAMLGQPLQMAYHHAVKWLFNISVDKDQTRSNWCRRPLHTRQLRYAALDVVLLPMMLQRIKPRLEEAGRWEWLVEDVERMKRNSLTPVEPEKAYLRFPGIGRMDEPGLKALQALAAWREETAKKKNRARGFVISDAGLMQLARLRPASDEEIREIEDVHPSALNRYQAQLLRLITDSQSSTTTVENIENLSNYQNKQLKAMRRSVSESAQELGIDPALLASKKELEKLIRAAATGRQIPERFLGWRKEIITEDLMPLLD
jgi:ribonuclease D